jgi:hypothetical protein
MTIVEPDWKGRRVPSLIASSHAGNVTEDGSAVHQLLWICEYRGYWPCTIVLSIWQTFLPPSNSTFPNTG